MKAGFLALASASLCVSGCASVLSSQNVASLNAQARGGGRADGEVYFLPRAIITAHVLVKADTGIEVALDAPRLVIDNGDQARPAETVPAEFLEGCSAADDQVVTGPFVLNYSPTGFHKDEITVEVQDGLLKTANAKSDEQISLIAPKLAESLAKLENDAGLDAIYSTDFDPGDCRSVAAARYRIGEAIITRGLRQLQDLKSTVPVARGLANSGDLFQLQVQDYKPFRFPVGARPTPADCAKGICVPVLTPAYVAIGSGATLRRGPMMMIPNGSDPAVIPVERSPFANVETKLSLSSGVLAKREVTRTSEALTIASIPAAVVGASLDAVAGVFTKRKAALDAAKTYREAVDAIEKKKTEANEEAGGAKQESDVSGHGLVSIGIAGAYRAPTPVAVNSKPDSPVVNQEGSPATRSNDGN
ncbi:hypothetical protein OVA11_19595 [Caulobacter sp. SL161]|uniref:hypothetical protein n=1 Tax=Caulobacter sp. SL161 TaxID=2995156 RepID=UPI00227600FD|nr:hypothetical protein [Caulobacter sp. SL161]MCY1649181.1 hypothetical protein [Caulobacter sp. SL161]